MCTQYISNDFLDNLDDIPGNEVRQLYYDDKENVMIDEFGAPVADIYRYITPNDLYLFKKTKDYMLARSPSGAYIELIYPNLDMEEIEMNY